MLSHLWPCWCGIAPAAVRAGVETEVLPALCRLAQEGLPCVLPHMTRQLCFASTADLRQLLRRRRVDALDFASSAMRAAVAAAQPGSLVVVHDPRGRGALVAGEPLPLAIAAMRSGGHAPRVDCLVKKAETNVMFLRLDADDAAARA